MKNLQQRLQLLTGGMKGRRQTALMTGSSSAAIPKHVRRIDNDYVSGAQLFGGESKTDVLWPYMGDSDDGRNWAMLAVHPMGNVATCIGLPDTIGANTATPSYRAETNISWDTTMFASAPTNPTTYTIQIVTPPIPEIDYIYRLRDDASGVWSRARVVRTPGFNVDQSGTVSQAQTFRSIGYQRTRIIASGRTFELNAAELANQGRVISGQMDCIEDEGTRTGYSPGNFTIAGVPPTTTAVAGFLRGAANLIQTTELVVPADSQFLVANCPKVYQAEAKEGAYVVHKFSKPLSGYDFSHTGSNLDVNFPGNDTINAEAAPASYCSLTFKDAANIIDGEYEFTADSVYKNPANQLGLTGLASSNIHPYVSFASGMLTGVTFFEGLVVGAGSTTVVSSVGATVRVKSRFTVEGLSYGSPAIVPFITPSPLFDRKAIDTVVHVSQLACDAYPASYNGFGDILGKIWNGISSIAKPVIKIAKHIPGVGTIANYAEDIVGWGDTLANAAHQATTLF